MLEHAEQDLARLVLLLGLGDGDAVAVVAEARKLDNVQVLDSDV